jgi:myo-inositol 2-dehydrogenase / D-chiro-inositol 1-dehydrogenase
MRLGLTGLGRIAFRATTLTDALMQWTPRSSTTSRGLVEAVVQPLRAERAAMDDLLAAGIDGVVIAAATDVHPELILATLPPPCPCTSIA